MTQISNTKALAIFDSIFEYGAFKGKQNSRGYLIFLADGLVKTFPPSNLNTWGFNENCIVIQEQNGEAVCEFSVPSFSNTLWLAEKSISRQDPLLYLSVNNTRPVKIPFFKEIERIAEQGKFFLGHPRRRESIFRDGDIMTIFPQAFIEEGTTLPRAAFFAMGAFSYVAGALTGNLKVGRYCSLGQNVRVFGNAHPTEWLSTSPVSYSRSHYNILREIDGDPAFSLANFKENFEDVPVQVGNDVWIGADCLLKPGISIGDGAVIATRSVVTKSVPPYAIVAGAPATIRKFRFEEATIARLNDLCWWRYEISRVDVPWDDVPRAIDLLNAAIEAGLPLKAAGTTDYALEILRESPNP